VELSLVGGSQGLFAGLSPGERGHACWGRCAEPFREHVAANMIEFLAFAGLACIIYGLAMPRPAPSIIYIERAIVFSDDPSMHVIEVPANVEPALHLGAGPIIDHEPAKGANLLHSAIRRALVVGALVVLLIGAMLAWIGTLNVL
jgi:hypothetical protein